MSLLDDVKKLLSLGIGDTGRLEHIKITLEDGKTLYDSDEQYIIKLTEQYLSDKTETKPDKVRTLHPKETSAVPDPTPEHAHEKDKLSPKFHSIKLISKLTIIAFILSISITVIYDMSSLMEINMLQSIDDGITISDDAIDANDLRVGILAGLDLIMAFTAMILFFIWFYKSYKNLPSLGAKELPYSSRWVILRFFIPILWFYQPYRATKDIWKSGDPNVRESDKHSRDQMKTPILIKFWWALWILGNMVGWIYLKSIPAMMNVDTISGYIVFNYMDMISDIPLIILDVLTLILVLKISSNQEKKNELLKSKME